PRQVVSARQSERGLYTVSGFSHPADPSETARMLSLAAAALLERNVAEPRRHVVLTAQNRIATLLMARQPFSEDDLRILHEVASTYEHRLLISPTGTSESGILERILPARD